MYDDQCFTILEIEALTSDDLTLQSVADLLVMYRAYAERHSWALHVRHQIPRRVCLKLEAPYGKFKYETGFHRIIRVVPDNGRSHLEYVSVFALPELTLEQVGVQQSDFYLHPVFMPYGDKHVINPNHKGVALRHKSTQLGSLLRHDYEVVRDEATALQHVLHMLRASVEQGVMVEYREPQNILKEQIRSYNFVKNSLIDRRLPNHHFVLEAIMRGGLGALYDALANPA